MIEYLEGEMSEKDLKARFTPVIEDAATAFSLQSDYATDIVLKARAIRERRTKKFKPVSA